MSIKKYFIFGLMSIIFMYSSINDVSALYTWNTGWRVDYWAPQVTDLRPNYGVGNSYQISAPWGKSVFIPTKTAGEWNSVKTNAASAGITMNASVDGGWSVWYYWYSDNYGCGSYTYDYYIRYCNSPSPAYGGAGCIGGNTYYSTYYNGACPTCTWTTYSVVGPCTPSGTTNCTNDWANNWNTQWCTYPAVSGTCTCI